MPSWDFDSVFYTLFTNTPATPCCVIATISDAVACWTQCVEVDVMSSVSAVWLQSTPPVRELLMPTVNVISQSRLAFSTPLHQQPAPSVSSSQQQMRSLHIAWTMIVMFTVKLYKIVALKRGGWINVIHGNTILVTIFSERNCMLSPVRLSSVYNVCAPYSADWNFPQCFYAIWNLGHSLCRKRCKIKGNLVSNSVTWNDLEWCNGPYFVLFYRGALCKIGWRYVNILRQKCSPKHLILALYNLQWYDIHDIDSLES